MPARGVGTAREKVGNPGGGLRYLVVHGHFYQPPRENPFAGDVVEEVGCEPYQNCNLKVAAECYRPNAENGNFGRISFDLGPTLGSWLERHEPRVHDLIVAADREHVDRYHAGNALAQPYNHTILPLASSREKRIQIAWGITDFFRRFGRLPQGMWLPETAVDYETLEIMSAMGLRFTILAPWQADRPVDPSEPYWVALPSGRRIAVFFYNAELSGRVSFDAGVTLNADAFGVHDIPRYWNRAKIERHRPQLLLIATDGELYGHHQPARDRFLAHLLKVAAPREGYTLLSLERYLRLYPPVQEIGINPYTSWSCHHGVQRWRDDCGCTEGDGSWKWYLRSALNRLAAKIDLIFEMETASVLKDPWDAAAGYLTLRLGMAEEEGFWRQHASRRLRPTEIVKTRALLEALYYRQLMFTSCGFFFEDLDRLEPRNDIAFAAKALEILHECCHLSLYDEFLDDLAMARSWRTRATGRTIFEGIMANRLTARLSSSRPALPAEPSARAA